MEMSWIEDGELKADRQDIATTMMNIQLSERHGSLGASSLVLWADTFHSTPPLLQGCVISGDMR